MSQSSWRRSTWKLPLLLDFGSIFALLAALAGEGVWDWISWLLLAAPILVVGWFWLGRKGSVPR